MQEKLLPSGILCVAPLLKAGESLAFWGNINHFGMPNFSTDGRWILYQVLHFNNDAVKVVDDNIKNTHRRPSILNEMYIF